MRKIIRRNVRGAVYAGGVALSLLGLTAPAVAQHGPPIGSRLGEYKGPAIEQGQARSLMAAHDYATCVVHRRESQARAFLDAATEADLDKTGKQLFREVECLSLPGAPEASYVRQLRMPLDIQRGIIAEALDKHDGALKASFAPLPLAKTYAAPWAAVSGRGQVVDEMSVCVEATDPQGVNALLSTRPGSDEEKQAFGAVAPYLGPCLQSGAQLTANRQSLRAALAEALYHRWEAQQAGGSATTAAGD